MVSSVRTMHSLVLTRTHSLTHLLTYLLTYSLTHSLTPSLTHLLTHSYSLLLTHLHTHCYSGAVHATDVTNASRTLLMNIKTLQWDKDILASTKIPTAMLPAILSSSEVYGHVTSNELKEIKDVPISG